MGSDAQRTGRKGAFWWAPVGVAAVTLFGAALGAAATHGADAPGPGTHVLGTQFVRETTSTTTTPRTPGNSGQAPLDGGKVTVRIDRAPTTTTRPPRTTTTQRSNAAPRSSGQQSTATTQRTTTTTQRTTATTSATLPPRVECGTGAAQSAINVGVTPIVATHTWTVKGTVTVTNGVSKPITLDTLTVLVARDPAAALEVPVAGAPGTVLNPGDVREFAVDIESDAQPTAVHISHLGYHVAGIAACTVA